MPGWNSDLFIAAIDDYEKAQYKILAKLGEVRQDFSHNRLYPHLGELIATRALLRIVLDSEADIHEKFPGVVKDVDLEAGEVIYEKPQLEGTYMRVVRELMEWTFSKITELIYEGSTIFEFVEDNLKMEEVGMVSLYLDEGYLFIPDVERGSLNILEYTLSIYTSSEERYRSLRTKCVKSVSESKNISPEDIKISLLEERPDLPNPLVFSFEMELDFPYEPTVLPVAKRKVLRHLSSNAA
ncbi:MAG: hypothetical protein WDZ70_02830 [Candidatus Paceibacterota bacterium]